MNKKTNLENQLSEVLDALSSIEILLDHAFTVANDQFNEYFSLNPNDQDFRCALEYYFHPANVRHDMIQGFVHDAREQITALNTAVTLMWKESRKEQETA